MPGCRYSLPEELHGYLVWHGNLMDVPAGAKRLGVQPVSTTIRTGDYFRFARLVVTKS